MVCIDYNVNTAGASEDSTSEKWPFKATFVNESGKVMTVLSILNTVHNNCAPLNFRGAFHAFYFFAFKDIK